MDTDGEREGDLEGEIEDINSVLHSEIAVNLDPVQVKVLK